MINLCNRDCWNAFLVNILILFPLSQIMLLNSELIKFFFQLFNSSLNKLFNEFIFLTLILLTICKLLITINNISKFQIWSAYRNSWTLDARVGRWTLDTGLWMLNSGLWTPESGRRTLDAEPSTLDAGLRTLDVRCYTLNNKLWAMDTIVDCFRTKSEASFWFCLIKLLKILWVQMSIRTLWSRLLYRDCRFWLGYF